MTKPIVVPQPPVPTWTLEEVLEILSKLPDLDLIRILKQQYPEELLAGMNKPSLLELIFSMIDIWSQEEADSVKFLISATAYVCKSSFEAFVRLFWSEVPGSQPLLWNWHLSLAFCQTLQNSAEPIFAGEEKPHDLICNVSPGTSKSTIWSILFPCWAWTRMPDAKIITASHTDSLVTDLAARSRDVMKSPMYRMMFPEIEFTEVQDAKGNYRNTKGGERFTCTIAGKSPTGRHAHFLIVDDPLDPKKVLSEAERRIAADFMTKVVPSRRMRGAYGDVCVTMLVMQRLGLGDPTEVLLEVARRENAAKVIHICLPAELTEDVSPKELRKYYEGYNSDGEQETHGLMDPVRLNRKALNEQRSILGEWAYAGQYLQKPRAPSGGMFKLWFFNNTVAAAPYNARRCRYWDRASSAGQSACATAGVLMAFDGEKIYVEDVVYGRWEPDERNAVMRATALKDRARYGRYEPVIWVEAEGGSAGRDAWLGVVRTLIGFTVKEDVVRGSKDTRAEPWATQLAARNVWLVDNGQSDKAGTASWDINGYIEDHLSFRPMPGQKLGREKDRIDASSGAFNKLVGLRRMVPALQTFALKIAGKNQKGRWLVACSLEEYETLEIERHPTLTIFLTDPDSPSYLQPAPDPIQPLEPTQPPVASPIILEQGKPPQIPSEARQTACVPFTAPFNGVPFNGAKNTNSLAAMQLSFADLDPAEYQSKWDQLVPPWNKKPEELQLTREMAKKLWAFLLKQYDKAWEVVILVDSGTSESHSDGRALSVAMAMADMLRLPRTAIYLPDGESANEAEIPNPYVYDVVKSSRYLVAV